MQKIWRTWGLARGNTQP